MTKENIILLMIIIFPLLFICSCKQEVDNNIGIIKIDFANLTEKQIYTDEIFDTIEYICLETLSECLLIDPLSSIYITDDHIIAKNTFKNAYLFDRRTGKFIHEIGEKGQGPNEYNTIAGFSFNEKEGIIYVNTQKKWLGINVVSNKVIERINYPNLKIKLMDNFELNFINGLHKMDSLFYIGYTNNLTGNSPYLLAIFDKEGNIIKIYPNYQQYIDYRTNQFSFGSGYFYEYKDLLYFKEYRYNDTVFQVNKDTIIPHIVFDLIDKKPIYAEQENPSFNRNYFYIENVWETNRYIFFYYWINNDNYEGYYDKKKRTAFVSLSKSIDSRGFIHKNNQYPPFHIVNVNEKEEIVSTISASKMMAYIEKNKTVKYPKIFDNLRDDDNSIVAIAKIKQY